MKTLQEFVVGEPLREFSRDRDCPKCGCAFIETKYYRQHDVMVRSCPCGYTWREKPLDRKTQS